MELLNCRACGAPLEIKENAQIALCPYCGMKQSIRKNSGDDKIKNLLERGFMLLQDGKFKKADKYFEKVLDVNPREAKAHLEKFMVENEITSTANIQNSKIKRNIGIFSVIAA